MKKKQMLKRKTMEINIYLFPVFSLSISVNILDLFLLLSSYLIYLSNKAYC